MTETFHGFNGESKWAHVTKSEINFSLFPIVVNFNFRLDDSNVVQRQVFVQEHSVRRPTDDKPAGRTLFAVNIPPYVHEDDLEAAYNTVGNVERVAVVESVVETTPNAESDAIASTESTYFSKTKPIDKFKAAYIVFKSTKSLRKAQNTNELDVTVTTGIAKWRTEYEKKWVDEKALEAEVNEYMAAFEAREQEAKADAKKLEIDEDGWVTVKRGKAGGGGFEQKESTLKALEEKIAKGKEKKELPNFYTFQIRQSKHKHIVSLRKRFAEDKLKIEALKKARRFKPF